MITVHVAYVRTSLQQRRRMWVSAFFAERRTIPAIRLKLWRWEDLIEFLPLPTSILNSPGIGTR